MKQELIKYILPEYWKTALFYDCVSGLDDDELDQVLQFIYELELDGVIATPTDISMESNFVKYHDVQHLGVLACECLEYSFYKITTC